MISKAALILTQKNKTIWIAQPPDLGTDYNDLLKNKGSDAVKNRIENAMPFDDYQKKNREPSITLRNFLVSAQKNNVLLQNNDVLKKSPEPYLNKIDNDITKSISIPPVKVKKIKEVEMEL